MGILGTLLLGFVIGVIAKALYKGVQPGGIVGSIIVGVLGAFVGTYVATLFDESLEFPPDEFFDVTIWVYSVIGALIVLFVYNLIISGAAGSGSGRKRR